MSYSRLSNIANLFFNDLEHVIYHAVGEQFDAIITICDTLCEELAEEIDLFKRNAIIDGEKVDNSSNIKSYIDQDSEWTPLSDEAIDWYLFIKELAERGQKYIDELEDASASEDIIYFWKNEVLFKNSSRQNDRNFSDIDTDNESSDEEIDKYTDEIKDESEDTNDQSLPNVDWKGLATTSSFGKDPGAIEDNKVLKDKKSDNEDKEDSEDEIESSDEDSDDEDDRD